MYTLHNNVTTPMTGRNNQTINVHFKHFYLIGRTRLADLRVRSNNMSISTVCVDKYHILYQRLECFNQTHNRKPST